MTSQVAVDLRTAKTLGADRDSFQRVRDHTERLAAPLSAEDQSAQSMPDASPVKWHRAHTSWFFEEFLLSRQQNYQWFNQEYRFLFNSYYEAVGERQPRPQRGLITRPSADQVTAYRAHVDEQMHELLDGDLSAEQRELVLLGLHHEQQHQELLLMDVKHLLFNNPFHPTYSDDPLHGWSWRDPPNHLPALTWQSVPSGNHDVGAHGTGFAYDNEGPRHPVIVPECAVSTHLVTNADWQQFIADGGYQNPQLWLSDGWAHVQDNDWQAPLYWLDDQEQLFTLTGVRKINPSEPVQHISYYEADAFARWSGYRLPSEQEWEVAGAHTDAQDLFGRLWQWTASPYVPYPGFRVAPGAVGEYNGKFMVDQQVLRGSSFATPAGHARSTYRNFYPARSRWPFTGLRLARDLPR